MRTASWPVLGTIVFCLTGCSIHPLPEDVAPLNTVEIVEHIRCEMHDAVRHQVVLAFRLSQDPRAHAIADDLEKNPDKNPKVYLDQIARVSPVYKKRLDAFDQTVIGYGFRFNITEKNGASGSAGFTLPYTPLSTFTLGLGGGVEKTRANTRRFFKVETFDEVLFTDECANREAEKRPNFAYPITGEVGLKNVVTDFVKLTTRGAKSVPEKDVPNFSEQLEFTTRIFGSATPAVEIKPVADVFKLTSASLNVGGERIDVHELTVTFALEAGVDTKTLAAAKPRRRQAVLDELRDLRKLDALERGGLEP